MPLSTARSRRDRCPGVLRPWPAEDGALARVRLAGGRLSAGALAGLTDVALRYGDGQIHLTGRANLQLRALPWDGDRLPAEVVVAIEQTGLLPSRRHELARNLMCSPLTGRSGGRVDLGTVLSELDHQLCARPSLARLPGRFLFVLDDGRGDLVDRETDLGAVALDDAVAQLRVGSEWGPVLPLPEVPAALLDLAESFLTARGDGPTAAWHVDELTSPLAGSAPADPRLPASTAPLPYGPVAGVLHAHVPDGVLTRELAADLVRPDGDMVVTPWHGVLVMAR